MQGRALYRYDADESPSTYITNYLVTAICVAAIVIHIAKPPTPQPATKAAVAYSRMPPSVVMAVHLGLFGVVFLIGGLGHHVWKHDKCPGVEMPSNTTVACPSGRDNEPVIRTYLFFLGPCVAQLVPLGAALSGLADRFSGAYMPIAIVSNVIGLALGILCAVVGHPGFFILGGLMLFLYLLLSIAAAVGLCAAEGSKSAKLLVSSGSLCVVVGGVIQFVFTSSCGASAYAVDGASGCPFGGDGVNGVNHNFVYHVFEILSKIALAVSMRHLVAGKAIDVACKAIDVTIGA